MAVRHGKTIRTREPGSQKSFAHSWFGRKYLLKFTHKNVVRNTFKIAIEYKDVTNKIMLMLIPNKI